MANLLPLRRRETQLARPAYAGVIVARVSLLLRRETPHASRDYAASLLEGAGLDVRAVYDVTTVISELVTASYLAGATGVELGIEIHPDQVTVVVRDDRKPSWRELLPAGRNAVREALLDAITTTRSAAEDVLGMVNVASFALTPA
jgi:hypothetical protein